MNIVELIIPQLSPTFIWHERVFSIKTITKCITAMNMRGHTSMVDVAYLFYSTTMEIIELIV